MIRKSFVYTGVNRETKSKYSCKGYELERLSNFSYRRRWQAIIASEAGRGPGHRPRWACKPQEQIITLRTKAETDAAFEKEISDRTAKYGKPLSRKSLPTRKRRPRP